MSHRFETIVHLLQYYKKKASKTDRQPGYSMIRGMKYFAVIRVSKVGKYSNLIQKYKIIGDSLPIEVNMDGTVGRIAVLIADDHSIGHRTHLQDIIKKYQSEKDLRFLQVAVDDNQNIDEVARKIGQTAFAMCFPQLKNQVKLSLNVVDESIGYDNKVELNCRISGTNSFSARPNKTDEHRRFVIDVKNGESCKFTCHAHYMYGVSISQELEVKMIAKPPKNIKKNTSVMMKSGEGVNINCRDGGRLVADISWTFN
uniref:Ig-like domain-containing protein n=1 Tax=Romanomermis culicivorax TaxID=13658 RepID=A0A915JZS5_ROMCU